MLGKGFGDVGEAKGSSTTGSQFLEQFKTAQALAQLAAQHTQPGGSTAASSWDMGSTTQPSALVQYGKAQLLPGGSPLGWQASEPFRDCSQTVRAGFCGDVNLLALWMERVRLSRHQARIFSSTLPAPDSRNEPIQSARVTSINLGMAAGTGGVRPLWGVPPCLTLVKRSILLSTDQRSCLVH